jgi:hypothetical protein
MVKFGRKEARSFSGGRRKRFRAKMLRADVQILAVDRPIRHVLEEAVPQPVVVGLADGMVHGTPPDLVARTRLADHELVER